MSHKPDMVGAQAMESELSNAHKEARVSREDFRQLVNNVKDYAIFLLSPDGYVQTWNQGAELLKGYTSDEIIGRHFSIFYTEPDRDASLMLRLLKTSLEEGRVEHEGYRVRKDGSVFWADVVITPIFGTNGEHIGFTKITRDLTDRRLSEESLRQSEERFRLMIEGVKDYAIFMLDTNGYIATWNQGAQKFKGYTADEILGKHFSIFYSEESKAMQYPEFELKMAIEKGHFEEENWRYRKDGSRFWANVLITSIYNEKGEHIGFCKVTRDLTERRIAEEKLKFLNENLEKLVIAPTEEAVKARKEAEQANLRKSQFLANMSHELRSPLNAVIGYTEMALQGHAGELSEKLQKYLVNVSVSASHLLNVVNDLLDISRIEAGEISLYTELVQLPELLKEIEEAIAVTPNPLNVTIEYDISPNLPDIHADRTRLKQIFINLINNAIKYNKPNGRVTTSFSFTSDSQFVQCEFQDTGIGISPDALPSIFDAFYQVDNSYARKVEGNGLGLFIVKRLVELHKGTISITSELEIGTCITIILPIA